MNHFHRLLAFTLLLTTASFGRAAEPASATISPAAAEAKKLRAELDRYATARPPELARHVSAALAKEKAKK